MAHAALTTLAEAARIAGYLDRVHDQQAAGDAPAVEVSLAEAERLLDLADTAVASSPYYPLRVYDISTRDPLVIPLTFAGPLSCRTPVPDLE